MIEIHDLYTTESYSYNKRLRKIESPALIFLIRNLGNEISTFPWYVKEDEVPAECSRTAVRPGLSGAR